mmetsp:Transcript_115731/g.247372  ORF Transcript_115731/g.247372 Transcript_115731/m.247372 type:complete len:352 (+) Transcript_115731:49-1104(+)
MGPCRVLALSMLVLSVALLIGRFDQVRALGVAVLALSRMDRSDFDSFLNSYDVFDAPQNDSSDETKVNSVYKVLVPLMGLGWLNKFYIPPVMDPSKVSFPYLNHQQVLFEQKMADTIGLGPGKVALDIGCGQGLIADTVQEHTGAKIVGINISPEQLALARDNAKRNGKLGTLLQFDQASMNDDPLPFPDRMFDAVYVMQAITYVHDAKNLMREVRRILKPGGMFSDLSIVTLGKYNPKNETHYRMLQNAKRVSVVPTFRPVQVYEDACTSNGFSLKISEHLGHADMTQAATDYFTPLGDKFMNFFYKIGLISDGVMASMNRMNEYAKDLIQGDREDLFTINYWIVCQAPL